MAKKPESNARYISVGTFGNLIFIQPENIVSAKIIKSDNPYKPYCLHFELTNGKSKHVYSSLESDLEKDIKKISVEKEKILKANNFRS